MIKTRIQNCEALYFFQKFVEGKKKKAFKIVHLNFNTIETLTHRQHVFAQVFNKSGSFFAVLYYSIYPM